MAEQEQLRQLRDRIDELDEQIQNLITERARCALSAAEVKQAVGGTVAFYRPEREAQVLRQVKARNRGPLSDDTIVRLFREIISACMALEQVMAIAVPGTDSAYTEAVYKHFGRSVCCMPMADSDAVLRAVVDDRADFGVVDLIGWEEAGGSTADKLLDHELFVCGEVRLSGAFWIVGKQPIAPSGEDKTVLLVTAAARGPLLQALAHHGITVLYAADRSLQRDADLVVIAGHCKDPEFAQVLATLRQLQVMSPIKILGSYPIEVT